MLLSSLNPTIGLAADTPSNSGSATGGGAIFSPTKYTIPSHTPVVHSHTTVAHPHSKPLRKKSAAPANNTVPEIQTLPPRDTSANNAASPRETELMKQWEPGETKTITMPKSSGTTGSATRKPEVKTDELLKLMALDKQPTDFKQIAEQINKLRRNITDQPEDPFLRFKIGTYLFVMGDLEGAANELKTCLSMQPNNALARAQLARVLELGGDRHEALDQFKHAVEAGPNFAEIHYYFGECLMHGGNVSDAINEYRKAITLKPDADSYSGLSEALLMANDPLGAMKAARQAVSVDPSLARAQVALTNALLKSGDDQASLRTARQAALLNPNLPESHIALGRCLFTKGDLSGAVEEFTQAVGLDPLNFQARNDLGYALYRRGDIPSAISEFRLALRLNPHFVEAKNNLEVAIHGLYGETKH